MMGNWVLMVPVTSSWWGAGGEVGLTLKYKRSKKNRLDWTESAQQDIDLYSLIWGLHFWHQRVSETHWQQSKVIGFCWLSSPQRSPTQPEPINMLVLFLGSNSIPVHSACIGWCCNITLQCNMMLVFNSQYEGEERGKLDRDCLSAFLTSCDRDQGLLGGDTQARPLWWKIMGRPCFEKYKIHSLQFSATKYQKKAWTKKCIYCIGQNIKATWLPAANKNIFVHSTPHKIEIL